MTAFTVSDTAFTIIGILDAICNWNIKRPTDVSDINRIRENKIHVRII